MTQPCQWQRRIITRGVMQYRIVVLPGDGVGPEVTRQVVWVLREVANTKTHRFVFEEHDVGGAAIRLTGSPLPDDTLNACMRADAVLLGAISFVQFDPIHPA